MLKNPQHERFAQEVAKGRDNTMAYQAAYPGTGRVNARKSGSRLRTIDGVNERISDIQQKAEDRTVLSIAEKRRFYATIIRTPIGEIDETSPLCQAVKRIDGENPSVEYKMPDKLKATQLDNELSGHVKAAGTTVNVGVKVTNISVTEEQMAGIREKLRLANERAKAVEG